MQRVYGAKRAALVRGAGYLALWIVLIGLDPLDLAVGVVASAAATWASLRLLAPGTHAVRLGALPGFALRFLRQSVVAGVDVAHRAFSPRMPLRPGFVTHPTGYPRGAGRNAFASLSSLLPGTVPVRDDAQGLLYHCLDVEQPVLAALAEDEAAVARVLPRTDRA
ncbi:MAG: Na+/H+ antiporter subunit E [Burkholderiales bacterium]|nr:Na+/H+ antiporter subunit E [Burkholderiales bacterium]